MKNRFEGEGGRFIANILEMSESHNLKGYIITIDTEKALDSLTHSFSLACLKYGYGNEFVKCIEMFLEWIINGGHTTKYFKLQKVARQGGLVSAYLFVLCIEIVFIIETKDLLKNLLIYISKVFRFESKS